MNDVGFPVSAVLDGIAAAERCRAAADQGQHGRAPRHQRDRTSCPWRATSASAATSCVSSSTWTLATPTAGGSTTSCRPTRSLPPSMPRCRSIALPPNYPGEVADRWAYRDGGRRGGRHCLGHAAVLPRLHARAPHRRRPALHVPLRERRPRPARRRLRAGATDAELADAISAVWARPHRPLLGAALAGHDAAAARACLRSRPRGDVAHRRLNRCSGDRSSAWNRARGPDRPQKMRKMSSRDVQSRYAHGD